MENVDLQIEAGKMTAILGKNGCGKSTLIKLISHLLPLSEGSIFIDGKDISTAEGRNEIRRRCGIVFQNPDNQFVSPIIEDDIRFGLVNHYIPESKQPDMINAALETVGLSGYGKRNISTLSGGQKQRAAAAGILALQNDILIFDEATSMLDPDGRTELLQLISDLRKTGKTIIIVTQNIEDVLEADHIILLNNRQIIAQGSPCDVLSDSDQLNLAGVQVPFAVRVYMDLKRDGFQLPYCPITIDNLAEAICSLNAGM